MNILSILNGNEFEFAAEKDRKKNKIIAINAQRKDISLNEEKVYLSFRSNGNSLEETLEELRNLETKKNTLKNEIQLKEIYELIESEKDGLAFDDIFSLCFSSKEPLEKIALYEKLLQDRIFFKHKNTVFIPKDSQEVEQSLKQIEIQKQKLTQKNIEEELVFKWLKENLLKKEKPKTPDFLFNYLNIIKNFCIFGDDFAKKNQAIELLKRIADETGFNIDGNLNFAAFKFLKEIGMVEEDENLLLKKYSIALMFSEEEIQESEKIQQNFILNPANRKDYRDLFTVSIDDQETKDIDDAFSMIEKDNGYQFLVHIADVTEILPKEGALEALAHRRTSSIYLPDIRLPMFPQNLSEGLFSLLEGQDRYAVTYSFETNRDYQITSSNIELSIVNLNKNLNYEEVDKLLSDEKHPDYAYFKHFLCFAENFQKKRLYENKGVDFLFSDVYPRVANGEIKLKYYNPLSKSNLIIKELMVLSNFMSADFCQKNSISSIYICQDAPDNFIELEERAITNKLALLEIVKFMKKSYFSTHPARHFALGLSSYTQSTSPIRRYLDLVVQRQIKQFLLSEESAYSVEEIQEIKAAVEIQKPVISTLEGETNKYWLLKYLLLNFRNKPLDAIVTKELADGYLVELEKTLTSAKIITKNELKIGEKIKVKVHTILPRLGLTMGNF